MIDDIETRLKAALDHVAARVPDSQPMRAFPYDRTRATSRWQQRKWIRPLLAAMPVLVIAVATVVIQQSNSHAPTPSAGQGPAAVPSATRTDGPTGSSAKQSVRPPPTISHPDAVPCTASQLSFSYVGGGRSGGSNFGGIDIADTSDNACSLTGVVTVTALDASMVTIQAEAGWVNSITSPGIYLSAHGSIPKQVSSVPSRDYWAVLELGGDYRDDPTATNGLCAPQNEVTPAYWRITAAGASRDVANSDANASVVAVSGCDGHFDNVDIAPMP
jgi:hypothetical protein